jgi:hypothetical protein
MDDIIKFTVYRHNITNKQLLNLVDLEKLRINHGLTSLFDWCEENCQELYSCNHFHEDGDKFSITFYFKLLEDAVHFKLVNG